MYFFFLFSSAQFDFPVRTRAVRVQVAFRSSISASEDSHGTSRRPSAAGSSATGPVRRSRRRNGAPGVLLSPQALRTEERVDVRTSPCTVPGKHPARNSRKPRYGDARSGSLRAPSCSKPDRAETRRTDPGCRKGSLRCSEPWGGPRRVDRGPRSDRR